MVFTNAVELFICVIKAILHCHYFPIIKSPHSYLEHIHFEHILSYFIKTFCKDEINKIFVSYLSTEFGNNYCMGVK